VSMHKWMLVARWDGDSTDEFYEEWQCGTCYLEKTETYRSGRVVVVVFNYANVERPCGWSAT